MRGIARFVIVAPLLLALFACGGASAETHAKTDKPKAEDKPVEPSPEPAEPADVADAGDESQAIPPPPDDEALKLPVDAPLAPEVNAGVISRAAINAVLAQGIGAFLQNVRTEPQVIKGHFAGWRILSMFANFSDVHVAVLRPGDTVRRANGQSLERPETFKAVWDSLVTAKELVIEIERAGQVSKVRYTIAD